MHPLAVITALSLYFFFFIILFTYFWLSRVFTLARAFLQLWGVGAALQLQGSASDRSGFSCCGAWAPGCSGFSSCGSQIPEHRLNSRGSRASLLLQIFSDQGSNPCLRHWQADSLPLNQRGSLRPSFHLNLKHPSNSVR